uniref:uncharacterized protein LOC128931717 n=1 Tax=Callithrix jacchus TaxID=9483 RepID=UPI0023DD2EDE|nr:uncharacterized protein LOC128931717 [Callithrix jacchus]
MGPEARAEPARARTERVREGQAEVGRGGDRTLKGAGQLVHRLGLGLRPGGSSRAQPLPPQRYCPDVEKQPRNGGDSNLRTTCARALSCQEEPLVGGLRGALPSVLATGSARPEAERGNVIMTTEQQVPWPQLKGSMAVAAEVENSQRIP